MVIISERETGPRQQGEARRLAWAQRLSGAALSGESPLSVQPPSLAQCWERHVAAAERINAWELRGPRYAWGLAHTALLAVLYMLRWVAESAPRFLITLVAVALIIWTL